MSFGVLLLCLSTLTLVSLLTIVNYLSKPTFVCTMEKTDDELITLKVLRKRANLTQEELASRLKMSKSTVQAWERGEKTPQLRNAVELAKLLNVDLDTLCEAFGLDSP